MPLEYGDFAIFGKIGRESGSVSKNSVTHYLWGRVDRYVADPVEGFASVTGNNANLIETS